MSEEGKANDNTPASNDIKPPEEPKNSAEDDKTSDEGKNPSVATNDAKTSTSDDQKKPSEQKPKDPNLEKLKEKKREKRAQIQKESEERKVKRKEESERLQKSVGAKKIADESQLDRSGYEILRNQLIATGYYSKIYKAKKKSDDSNVCVKLVLLDKVPRDYFKHLTTKGLKIIRYVGQGNDQKAPKCVHFPKMFEMFVMEPTKLYIFMEEFQSLTVYTRIKTKDTLTEFEAKKWGKQLAEAIDCLQLAGIAHRNIRTENIIFDKKYDIKLVGFDSAIIFWNEEKQQSETQPKITPPPKELIRYDHLPPQTLKEDYDPSTVDVWSWAVFVCLVIHKQNPFDPKSTSTVEEQWSQYSTKYQFSVESKQLIDKCFVSDSSARIHSNDILQHKWLSDKSAKKPEKKKT